MGRRILLVAPYGPFADHDHAAADILRALVGGLSNVHDVHVYAPLHTQAERATAEIAGCTVWPARPAGSRRALAAIGRRPYWLREAWSRRMTTDVLEVVRRVRPEVVHCEYLLTGEVALAVARPTVLTFHDNSTDVMRRSFATAPSRRRAFRLLELLRTAKFEREVLGQVTVPVALSLVDRWTFASLNQRATHILPGITASGVSWRSVPHGSDPVVLFTGAMWRRANEAAVQRLVERIMPAVWGEHANAKLRVVGSRPTPRTLMLSRDPRVEVVGWVESLDQEVASASVAVCPTVIGGGVLTKVLRALEVGAPVVTDATSAASIGLPPRAALVAGDDEEFAQAINLVLDSEATAVSLASAGAEFAKAELSWDRVVAQYDDAYTAAVEAFYG